MSNHIEDQSLLIEKLAARVQHLEDIHAIASLKTQYAKLADAMFRAPSTDKAARVLELFVADGILELGAFGRYVGHEQILDAVARILPAGTAWSTHYMINHEIDVRGDTAEGRFYVLLQMQPRAPEDAPKAPGMIVHGSYKDKFVRTSSGWKFMEVISFLDPPV